MAKTKQDFINKIRSLLIQSRHINGLAAIMIKSKDLHIAVGDYPGPDHRMAVCCSAMREAMGPKDLIINDINRGQNTELEVLYSPGLGSDLIKSLS